MLKLIIEKNKRFLKSSLASILLHFSIFIILALTSTVGASSFPGLPGASGKGAGYYVEADFRGMPQPAEEKKEVSKVNPALIEKVKSSDKSLSADKATEKKSPASKEVASTEGKSGQNGNGQFGEFAPGQGDTSSLNNVYSENTLNVKIQYPEGWTFMDQNVKSKLDGVTFWSDNFGMDPPPYIFLEVREKYLFDQRKFKNKVELDDFTMYYNEPEEMEGQISQTIYIRTETSEDYSIKLIINGKTEFKAFQPVFFGMVETFKFGRKWL